MESGKSTQQLTSFEVEEGKGQKAVRNWQIAFTVLLFLAVAVIAAVIVGLLYKCENVEVRGTPVWDSTTPESPSGQFQYARAAVATDSGPCSEIGRDILVKGGSATDAAITALLCIALHNPQSAGIGGGMFMVHYNARTGTTDTLDARETAPLAATEDMFAREADDASTLGGLAIGVPGEMAGYWLAHQRYGVLPWKELFEPSISIAEQGFPVGKELANNLLLKSNVIMADDMLREAFTTSTGELFRAGEIMTRPKLAQTYRKVALEGGDAFYRGDLADDIVADIADRGGIITKEDLSQYRCKRRTALMIEVDDVNIYTLPPPSSGAVFSLIMNILEGYDFSLESLANDETKILTAHRIVEAFKFAFAGRSFLGDEDFVDVKELVENMTSQAYADLLREQIIDDATHDLSYYDTFYNQPDSGTSHLSVIDGDGNAVSITSTINLHFGSKVMGSRTGIIFNDEMDDFSKPNTTNYFGLPASRSNLIRPGKRPMSSMTPSIAVNKDGTVKMVVGASGGPRIITALAQVYADTLWFGDSMKEAIQRRRLHHQLVPNILRYEEGYNQVVINGLGERGNIPELTGKNGVVQGILRDKKGFLNAYSDNRKGGYPAGI